MLERHTDGNHKADYKSTLNRIDGEEPRLSLANFQDQMRTLSKPSNKPTARETDVPVSSLRLEGRQCGGMLGRRSQTAVKSGIRTAVKISDQSNLAEFNRILSKMHL